MNNKGYFSQVLNHVPHCAELSVKVTGLNETVTSETDTRPGQ